MSFIFGGNTQMSYEDLQRKRRIADAMIGQNSNAPRNVGEGLAAIGRALAARAIDKRVSAREKELQSDADKMWQAALGGFDMGGMYGGSYSGSAAYAGGGQPYTPDATDPAEIGGGGYALGDSVASPEMVASPKGDLAMGVETYSPDDREMLAKTLMAEAGGEGPQGMLAAGAVIDNRRKAGGYGNDWQGVIMKPGQFSAWNGVTGYAGGKGGLNMAGMKPSQAAYQVADALLSGRYDDPTGGATHYYNPAAANPAWGMQAGGEWQRIGNHVFGTADAGRKGAVQGAAPASSGPSVAAIVQAMANPMIRNDPAKMAIANMLLQRQIQASDPMYQMQLQQAQLQLEQARKGPKREIVKGADGFNYYLDTGERVLPNVQAAPPAKPGSVQEYEYGMANPDYNAWRLAGKKAGAPSVSTTVNTGDQPDARPMADKPEKGYQRRWDEAKRTWVDEPIPGGSADSEAQAAEDKKENRKQMATASGDVVVTSASRAREAARKRAATGVFGAAASYNPGSQNAEIYRQVEVLQSMAAAENINAMRQASPTGGALGNASDADIKLLKFKSGVLDPKSPNFERDLDDYERQLLRTIHGIEEGDRIFNETRKGNDKFPSVAGMNAAQIDEYMKANPSDKWTPEQRAAVIARLKELKGQE